MPIIRLKSLQVSTEMSVIEGDHNDGVARIEREYEFYGKIADHSEIETKAVSTEYQEQYEVKRKGGSLRVRMTKKGDEVPVYSLTLKARDPNDPTAKREVPLEGTEDLFTSFKALADNGMIKRRYYIPLEVSTEDEDVDADTEAPETPESEDNAEAEQSTELPEETPVETPESVVNDEDKIYWEVDVFYDDKGNRKDWCKIDLTVPSELQTVPPLPITLTETITAQYGERTQADIEKLTELFDKEFLIHL